MSNTPHKGLLVGYARTSTAEQEAGLEAQVRDLKAAGCTKIFQEQVSSIAERAELERALEYVRSGDTLVVTKVDRLARSTVGLWEIVKRLEAVEDGGAGLRVLNLGGETVDTKSATGKPILTIFAGFAQFEREMMLERQRERRQTLPEFEPPRRLRMVVLIPRLATHYQDLAHSFRAPVQRRIGTVRRCTHEARGAFLLAKCLLVQRQSLV